MILHHVCLGPPTEQRHLAAVSCNQLELCRWKIKAIEELDDSEVCLGVAHGCSGSLTSFGARGRHEWVPWASNQSSSRSGLQPFGCPRLAGQAVCKSCEWQASPPLGLGVAGLRLRQMCLHKAMSIRVQV